MCGSRQWASDVWSLSLAAFSFPSPADAEPPRGHPPAVKLRETARVGPETCAAPMSGRSTRGKGKSAAAAGKDASGIPAAAVAVVRLREVGLRQTTAPLPRAGPHPKVTEREEEALLDPAKNGSHSISVPVKLRYWISLTPTQLQ